MAAVPKKQKPHREPVTASIYIPTFSRESVLVDGVPEHPVSIQLITFFDKVRRCKDDEEVMPGHKKRDVVQSAMIDGNNSCFFFQEDGGNVLIGCHRCGIATKINCWQHIVAHLSSKRHLGKCAIEQQNALNRSQIK